MAKQENMGDFYNRLYAQEQGINSLPSSWKTGNNLKTSVKDDRHIKSQGKKGDGYYGMGNITTSEGEDMTEYTIGMNVIGEDGKEYEIDVPSVVPGLTLSEIEDLKKYKVSPSTKKKAFAHARKRRKEGRSVFAELGEKYELPTK
jgi:hypothetical protein